LFLLPAAAPHAYAADFTADTTADTVDISPGDGICADGGGQCSLRAAIGEANALAGADTITVHVEACVHLHRTLAHIRSLGKHAGVTMNPSTPEDHIRYVLEVCDQVLVMSVNPGFGGQELIRGVLPKVSRVRSMIEERGAKIDIEIDGGITEITAKDAIAAGARILVAGHAIFGSGDPERATRALRAAAGVAHG
jgi:ribulose-phosphate 3-epimerase